MMARSTSVPVRLWIKTQRALATNYRDLLCPKGTLGFRINPVDLRKRYIQLQTKYHPDRMQDPDIRKQSQDASSHINEAYSTMKSPYLRAKHILETMYNIECGQDTTDQESTPEMLEEIFSLFTVGTFGTPGKSTGKILEEKEDQTLQELQAAADANDVPRTKQLLYRLKYLDTVTKKLRDQTPD